MGQIKLTHIHLNFSHGARSIQTESSTFETYKIKIKIWTGKSLSYAALTGIIRQSIEIDKRLSDTI